jgi:cyanate lyase
MDKTEMKELLLNAKKNKRLTWAALAEQVGLSEVFVTSCCYGENSMTSESAQKLCATLDLDERVRDALTEFPTKATAWRARSFPPTHCSTASTRSCACTAPR